MNIDRQIDLILEAEDGHSLTIPCKDLSQMRSRKVKYWRALKKYQERARKDPNVIISMQADDDNFTLVLTKSTPYDGICMVTPSGEKIPVQNFIMNSDQEKRIRGMIEEGFTRERILKNFGGDPLHAKELELLESLLADRGDDFVPAEPSDFVASDEAPTTLTPASLDGELAGFFDRGQGIDKEEL